MDDEIETLSAALRQVDFLTAEIETIERELAASLRAPRRRGD